jgi:hypothetical protein
MKLDAENVITYHPKLYLEEKKMTEKQPELNAEVVETEKELTPAEKKKAEKEAKKLKQYAQSMITRQEAWSMAKDVANEEVGQLANFIREPLRANLVQTMALVELLIDRGVFTKGTFDEYLNKLATRVEEEAKKELGEVGQEESGEQPEGSTQEETEEQQS